MPRTFMLPLAMLCALAASLYGADPPKPAADPGKVLAEAQKKLLEKFDLDKNGVLSDDEKLKAQEELKKQGVFAGSGLLPGGFAGAEELLKKFDKNRDGKLSDDERLAAAAAMQRMQRGRGPAYGPGFGGVGPAGGSVAPTGSAPAGESEKPGRKVNPLVKRYDLDGDGKLNEAEKAALQADRGKSKTKDKKKADKKLE